MYETYYNMFISLSSWPFLVSPVLILMPSNTMIDLSEEYQIIKLIYVKNVKNQILFVIKWHLPTPSMKPFAVESG